MRVQSTIPTTKYGDPLLTRQRNKEVVIAALIAWNKKKYYKPKSFAFWYEGTYFYVVIRTTKELLEVNVRPSTASG